MMLMENERIDRVNDSLSLIQKNDGLTFGTDALLLAGYIGGKHSLAMELGGGTGIISMLLIKRGKAETVDAVEIQPEYAELIKRNAQLNEITDRLFSVCEDVRQLKTCERYDLVFTNPPYMKADGGKNNEREKKSIARHEIHGTVADFTEAAKRSLKFGGLFYAVYRPDRLSDLIYSMRSSGIEPKRMTFVHGDVFSEASIVLIEGKKGAKSGMMLTRPLIIYKDKAHREYTEDMDFIMENGSFPCDFKR